MTQSTIQTPRKKSGDSKRSLLFHVTLIAFLCQNVFLVLRGSSSWKPFLKQQGQMMSYAENVVAPTSDNSKPRIAIISGFVSKDVNPVTRPKVGRKYMDHLLNKVCYSHLWNYDYIFNTSWGFAPHERALTANSTEGPYWLDYGTWHRVPHMIAAMDRGYEWILYADVDYVLQDLTTPLESFMREWELYGQENVHVFVPDDDQPGLHVFSAYVVMIRNSDFGRRLLENWKKFGLGLCPNGNFPGKPGKYDWRHSDQPGLWYALAQTHSDMNHKGTENEYNGATCNETTGYLATKRVMGPELNTYMRKVGAIKNGNLTKLPLNQSIVWSVTRDQKRGGLGVQQTFGKYGNRDDSRAFAIHKKQDLPQKMMEDIGHCRKHHGCVANETDDGNLEIYCGQGAEQTGIVTDYRDSLGDLNRNKTQANITT